MQEEFGKKPDHCGGLRVSDAGRAQTSDGHGVPGMKVLEFGA